MCVFFNHTNMVMETFLSSDLFAASHELSADLIILVMCGLHMTEP